MKGKNAVSIVLLIVLVIALVCQLPFPSRVNSVCENGDGSTLTLSGTRYRYLLRDDRFKGTFVLKQANGSEETYEMLNQTDLLPFENGLYLGNCMYYDAAGNTIRNFYFTADKTFTTVRIDDP